MSGWQLLGLGLGVFTYNVVEHLFGERAALGLGIFCGVALIVGWVAT